MSRGMKALLLVGGLLALAALALSSWYFGVRNGMVQRKERFRQIGRRWTW